MQKEMLDFFLSSPWNLGGRRDPPVRPFGKTQVEIYIYTSLSQLGKSTRRVIRECAKEERIEEDRWPRT